MRSNLGIKTNLHHNIWCVGRNYTEHAKEMQTAVPNSPLFFLKSGSCLNYGTVIELPTWSKNVHHELELAFLIDENLSFSHISLALDLTARDAQDSAKKLGQPWTLSKSFKGSCPIGSWINLSDITSLNSLSFTLSINDIPKQSGMAMQMIFKPDFLLNEAKKFFPVVKHDILLTGTPSGVGPLTPGDRVSAALYEEKRTLLTCFWDVLSIE